LPIAFLHIRRNDRPAALRHYDIGETGIAKDKIQGGVPPETVASGKPYALLAREMP
jgi:hypothetical protein